MNVAGLTDLMDVAERKAKADLVIRNVGLLNLFTETVEVSDISIINGQIGRVSEADADLDIPAKESIDGSGKYLAPGFIDAHTHIEMSLLSPTSFVEVVLPQGTTGAIIDMHDVCNVGLDCMRHHACETASTQLKAHLMIPPCVPGTPKLEEAGATMTLAAMQEAFNLPNAHGIGETMDFVRVLDREPEILSILAWANSQGLKIDGHCPHLVGDPLQAYGVTGIFSDHESASLEEMHEKYRLGFKVILRRGSLREPVRAGDFVNALADKTNVLLSTDGCIFLDHLLDKGGMIEAVRQIISEGVDPLMAVKLASYNVARAYGIDHKVGVVAPGRAADLILIDDIETINIVDVFVDGNRVFQATQSDPSSYEYPAEILNTVKIGAVSADQFQIAAPVSDGTVDTRVMHLIEGTVLTKSETHPMAVEVGKLQVDTSRDLLKVAVFDRYQEHGAHALGIIRGFGFDNCSLGGTIGQDSQNLVAVGSSDDDMAQAVNAIREMQGGLVVVSQGKIVASVELPISGIMSLKKPAELLAEVEHLTQSLRSFGCVLENPAFNLSLLITCAVIPELKITNRGLVHAQSGEFVPLFGT